VILFQQLDCVILLTRFGHCLPLFVRRTKVSRQRNTCPFDPQVEGVSQV
jgi:hypothetical protein